MLFLHRHAGCRNHVVGLRERRWGEGYAIAEMASIASWDEADVMPDREPAKFFEGALESEKKANQIEVCRQPDRGPESRGRRFPTRLLSISLFGGFGYEKRI